MFLIFIDLFIIYLFIFCQSAILYGTGSSIAEQSYLGRDSDRVSFLLLYGVSFAIKAV